MKRLLRRILRVVIPESLKALYRHRRRAARESRVAIPLEFTETPTGSVAHVNRSFQMRITPDEKPNLIYHLRENGGSIDEMTGFFEAAKNARLLWDVGAHKGMFALFFCLLGAEKRAVAFEPSTQLLQRAKDLSALNHLDDRIEWNSCAIGDHVGTSRFVLENTGFATAARGQSEGIAMATTTL